MSSLNISLSLRKLPLEIEETQDLIDEKIRLYELDEPFEDDDLKKSLESIVKLFNYIDSELVYNLKEFLKNKSLLQDQLDNYGKILQTISSNDGKFSIDIEKYKINSLKCFEQEQQQQLLSKNSSSTLKSKKSVRFKDSLIDPPSSSSLSLADDQLKLNLFQTLTTPDEDDSSSSSSSNNDDFSNRQLFINNQQELLSQDTMLESLSGSIRTQHNMGVTINEELDDHMIILNDLEMMIDGTGNKFERGKKRLEKFNTKLKENGSWVTIVLLLVILIFLVVVL